MADTLGSLASMLNAEVEGDASIVISGVAGLDNAEPGHILFAEDARSLKLAEATDASAVIVGDSLGDCAKPAIRHANPKYAFALVLRHLYPVREPHASIHPTAVVAKSAEIGEDVTIGANAVVEGNASIGDRTMIDAGCVIGENVSIGSECWLRANVTIYHDCVLGNQVSIHSGSVIGGDGFGYVVHEGRHEKLLQVGNVVIGDDVEIGCSACVDRASFGGSTVIGSGCRIDNLVQIAHNADIGPGTILVSQVGIAGSAKVGQYCVLAGQVGVGNGAELGDKLIIAAQSGIPSNKKWKGDQMIGGSPAYDLNQWMRSSAVQPRLPDMAREFLKLKKEVAALKDQLDERTDSPSG
ncbi:MAG: UDP-3-O-(3-hydroxymyristoyl)glucosamine N-acyltransferase [Planctomycetota bacterium]|jgi:UDP-3-O-[3-hydroxymyristoyl] glucosamine N-acyltransferase|nr:UDP-3-O-(3-hydroxymyristoyl)glucosamine N-acyltransferase [Planctomycetota bacterium]MDP7253477.1 UDP-3-O-(3-hydroxymyristoyl)glucosamine N-acyltransferase [Planctomycetota bacterium]